MSSYEKLKYLVKKLFKYEDIEKIYLNLIIMVLLKMFIKNV